MAILLKKIAYHFMGFLHLTRNICATLPGLSHSKKYIGRPRLDNSTTSWRRIKMNTVKPRYNNVIRAAAFHRYNEVIAITGTAWQGLAKNYIT